MKYIGITVSLSVFLLCQGGVSGCLPEDFSVKAETAGPYDPGSNNSTQDQKNAEPDMAIQSPIWMGESLPISPSPAIAADLWREVKKDLDTDHGEKLVRVVLQTDGPLGIDIFGHLHSHRGRAIIIYQNLNMMAIELPASEVEAFANHHKVRNISPDRTVNAFATYDSHVRRATGVSAALSLASPNLSGLSGKGLSIAVLDSGVQTDHFALAASKAPSGPGFVSVSVVTGDTSTADAYGHGTHVACLAAGPGQNLSSYTGLYTGIAYNARLLNVRVLGADGSGRTSDVIAGIDWCIANRSVQNIRVINLSLGALTPESYKTDPLCQAAERAVSAGIVVVAAAGNNGKDVHGNVVYGGIHSPGIDPMVITVGATNTHGTDARSDDSVATYSSRGPTYADRLLKPDLVAPGNALIAAESYQDHLVTSYPQLNFGTPTNPQKGSLMVLNGTSMAAPIVSGTVALMLEKNPGLTPGLVKAIIQYTAQHLPYYNLLEQGAGELNAEGALRLAAAIKTTLPSTVGSALLATAMPTEQSTIAGESFNWFGRIYGAYNHILSGRTLFQEYQLLYTTGFCWVGHEVTLGGQVISNGHLLSDGTSLTDGFLLSDGIILDSPASLENWTLTSGLDVANGLLLADGHLLADAILLTNDVVLPDGHLLADEFANSTSFSALSDTALVYGDL
jgi:serine protease AprX